MPDTDELLLRIERYYDAVPRRFAQVEECGPLTLFLGEPGGWVYYARPRLGSERTPIDAVDVAAALTRLRGLGLPEVVEWVHETTPELLDAVHDEGTLTATPLPLLVAIGDVARPTVPEGVTVRLLTEHDVEQVAAGRAVSEIAFAAGNAGTRRADDGPRERDEHLRPAQHRVVELVAEGAVRIAVAEDERDGVLAVGRTLPIDGVAEVMGVGTLPSARRQGLGAAVTALLVDDARAHGAGTVFLTASDDAVARVYERVGFRRVATGYAAEPPEER